MAVSKKDALIKAVLKYYNHPHTVKETAEYFGLPEDRVKKYLEKFGKGVDDTGFAEPPLDFVFAWYDITVDILNALKVRYKAHDSCY